MTFRDKLADWLTGGDYGRYRSGDAWSTEFIKARNAVREIASIHVKPSSNGQTRKAVRIAKEALSND